MAAECLLCGRKEFVAQRKHAILESFYGNTLQNVLKKYYNILAFLKAFLYFSFCFLLFELACGAIFEGQRLRKGVFELFRLFVQASSRTFHEQSLSKKKKNGN